MYRKLLLLLTLYMCVNNLFSFKNIGDNGKIEHVKVLESNDLYTIIEINLHSYTKETFMIDDKEYISLKLPMEAVRLDTGDPELPIIARSITIPNMAKKNWEIISSQYTEFNAHVTPSKGELYRKINPNELPYTFSTVYQTDAFFPKDIVELGEPYIMREVRGLAIRISPFTYNPVRGIIRFHHHLVVKVFTDGIDTVNSLSHRSNKKTKEFEKVYQNRFINYTHKVRTNETSSEDGSILVIAHDIFMEAMEPYVEWKRQKGIPTTIVPISDAGDTGAKLQAFIREYYEQNPDLVYILLVGDSAQVPTLNFYTVSDGPSSSDPTYVMLVGNDNYPDAFIGRFSAETIEHVRTQVKKTIHYERDMYEGEWLSKGMGLAGNESGGHFGESDYEHMELIRLSLLSKFDSIDQMYQIPNSLTETAPSLSSISNAFNEGRGIMNYIAHGSSTAWVHLRSGANSSTSSTLTYTSDNVRQLKNDWKLPFIISVACDVGRFAGQTCFAETWLRATNQTTGNPTGAIAVYMSSMSQPWLPPMYAQDYINELIINEYKLSVGGLIFSGVADMLDSYDTTGSRDVSRTWHIFGDPSLMIRTKPPTVFDIIADKVITLPTPSVYNVNVGEPDVRVTLYDPKTKQIIDSVISDENGNADLNIKNKLNQNSDILLTVTGYNKTTYQSIIRVRHPGLLFESYALSGNSDLINDSDVDIFVSVVNSQNTDIQVASAVLSTNDRYITMIDDTINQIFTIPAKSVGDFTDVFSFIIHRYIPDQHKVDFVLTITDADDYVWDTKFSLTINAPAITALPNSYYTICTDTREISNLEAGKTVKLYIPFKNNGKVMSSEGKADLYYSSPYIKVLSDSMITAIMPDSTNYAVFYITATEDIPDIYLYFYLKVVFNTAEFSYLLYIPVGNPTESYVTVTPIIDVDIDQIDFMNTESDADISKTFLISNYGNIPLQGTITLPESGFTISNPNIHISPFERKLYTINFTPTENIDYTGVLAITTNDINRPEYNIYIKADYTNVSTSEEISMIATRLLGNYPNPFNPETTIKFTLATAQHVNLSVYNVRGQLVKTLTNRYFEKGNHSIVWSGKDDDNKDIASGIYFYQFSTPDRVQVNRMLLLK